MTDPRPTTVGGPELVTLGHIRSYRCRELLIYLFGVAARR